MHENKRHKEEGVCEEDLVRCGRMECDIKRFGTVVTLLYHTFISHLYFTPSDPTATLEYDPRLNGSFPHRVQMVRRGSGT